MSNDPQNGINAYSRYLKPLPPLQKKTMIQSSIRIY